MEYGFIKKWERASNYIGETYCDYYIVYSNSRDGGLLQTSNYNCITESLKNYGGFIEARFNHWGCGYLDVIMIHESDLEGCERANGILTDLSKYAIYNEDDFSQRVDDYAQELWIEISLTEKIDYCKQAGISIFSVRRERYPHDLYEYLTVDAY
jgi:hypothetical protein